MSTLALILQDVAALAILAVLAKTAWDCLPRNPSK